MIHGDRDIGSREHSIEAIVNAIGLELNQREEKGLDTILFFPVTGGEGCGKTTLLSNLRAQFEKQHIPVLNVKMLGGQETSEPIRNLVLSPIAAKMTQQGAIQLLRSAMCEAAGKVSVEAAERGTLLILADRSPWDTAVYNQFASGKSEYVDETISKKNLELFRDVGIPVTKTIFIDLDPTEGLQRKSEQGEQNRFEEMDVSYHERVRKGFQMVASHNREDFLVFDGTQTKEQLQLSVAEAMMGYLQEHKAEMIVGKPPEFSQIAFWMEVSPLRAARMLATFPTLLHSETDTYIEFWREVAFAMRDSEMFSVEAQKQAVQLFCESPFIQSIALFSLYEPEKFFDTLAKLNLKEGGEGKEQFWRYINKLQLEVDHEFREQGRRAGWDKRTIFWDKPENTIDVGV